MNEIEDLDDLLTYALTAEREHKRKHLSRLRQAQRFFLPTKYPPTRSRPMAKDARRSLKTPLFRGSYVNLAKPRSIPREDGTPGKPQFSMTIVLKKGEKSTKIFIDELTKLLVEAATDKHGANVLIGKDKKPRPPQKALKHWPIKDGDDSDNEAFQGCWTIEAKSNFKPSVIDKNGDELSTEDELFSGAWYKAKVSAYAWANDLGGKGVSVNLESAIKIKDDARFGGGSNAKDDFKDEVDEDEADEDSDLTG